MSLKALPIVFINLGGEMMYIIEQRLKAQKISPDKAVRVMYDLVKTMMNQSFLDELFKPQELYSRKAMKSVFEKLAHSSIMRLDTTSMDKLYDLMTMVFKYQVFSCPSPADLLFITLNHLDGIRQLVEKDPVLSRLVDFCHSLVLKHCHDMTDGEMQVMRYAILNFFQDLCIKVSVFLKEGRQHDDGKYKLVTKGPVPRGSRPPGRITEYSPEGEIVYESSFDVSEEYTDSLQSGSTEPRGCRGTKLGTNIYENYPTAEENPYEASADDATRRETERPALRAGDVAEEEEEPQDRQAQEELALLAHLIGCSASPTPQFTINLFPSEDEEKLKTSHCTKNITGDASTGVVEIDVSKGQTQTELTKIMSEFTFDESQPADTRELGDLLDLMDSAIL